MVYRPFNGRKLRNPKTLQTAVMLRHSTFDHHHGIAWQCSLQPKATISRWTGTDSRHAEAKRVIECWTREYDESRPHRSLGERTPSEFACQISPEKVV
jgi:hypothetical protein